MIKVSVIIPTFNREKYVVKAIQSVLGQKYDPFEIIVVDDGSSDGTKDLLNKYEKQIKYIYQKNSGVSVARNTGIKQAKGEWLAFLDSDDEWMPGYLECQIECIKKYPKVCMQAANILIKGINGESHTYFKREGPKSEFKGREYLYFEKPFNFIVGHPPMRIGAVIARREAIEKAGYFDEELTLSEDLDLMSRVGLEGPFGIINEVLAVAYRRDEKTEHLTKKIENDFVALRVNNEKIFKNLYQNNKLQKTERKTVKKVMGANRRAIGNLLIKYGRKEEARKSFKLAFKLDNSVQSIGKYIFSFLPEKMNLWLLDKNA